MPNICVQVSAFPPRTKPLTYVMARESDTMRRTSPTCFEPSSMCQRLLPPPCCSQSFFWENSNQTDTIGNRVRMQTVSETWTCPNLTSWSWPLMSVTRISSFCPHLCAGTVPPSSDTTHGPWSTAGRGPVDTLTDGVCSTSTSSSWSELVCPRPLLSGSPSCWAGRSPLLKSVVFWWSGRTNSYPVGKGNRNTKGMAVGLSFVWALVCLFPLSDLVYWHHLVSSTCCSCFVLCVSHPTVVPMLWSKRRGVTYSVYVDVYLRTKSFFLRGKWTRESANSFRKSNNQQAFLTVEF